MAFAVFFIMLLTLFLRERPGERLVAWSSGEASAEALASVNESWRDIVVILMLALTFTHESFAGFANWIALTGIIASVVGIAFGAMADGAGLVKVLFIFILLRMVGFVVFEYTEEY